MALIIWLSESAPLRPRIAATRPAISLAALAHDEILSLTDPTIFPATHPDGFSGQAWLMIAPHRYAPIESGVAPQWLSFEPEGFADTLHDFVKSKTTFAVGPIEWVAPTSTRSDTAPIATFPTNSSVVLDGGIAARRLLGVPSLKSWPCDDVLPPSIVQVLIDKRGIPISAVLLTTCGFKPADIYAVDMAKTAVFEPSPDFASGSLVFLWHTLPTTGNGTATMH